jgi:hypothetical protein
MSQQTTPSPPPAAASLVADTTAAWLTRESLGRNRLRHVLSLWLQRNNWSLAVVSRLAELALLAEADAPVPDWTAGMPLQPGDWVNHKGHAWQAVGTPLSEPAEADPGWSEKGLTSRLHASGLNLFLRNRNRTLTTTFLQELGRLNEWVAAVQKGTKLPPDEPRLRDLVQGATVLKDQEGVFGPEEFLSIALDRLTRITLPSWTELGGNPGGGVAAAEPSSQAGVPARQLRAAAAAAGLDIIEDWPTIVSLYPVTDPPRQQRLQHVLQGLAQWNRQQEEEERAACMLLLQRLQRHAVADSARLGPGANAALARDPAISSDEI